ncbi:MULTISPECIES: zinc ribbon domain-containing protein [unclassified Arthrobacter]|uniref:zinc ribbon domain-containing protein n=1 Tax=unclassified Arthrobacter TaxID=235627 RepID=UPI001492D90B|nr:C4-type zinc ribbon domain-containing protein [Arthrobacter sp. AET 35A]MBE0010193.1 DNA-binding protein [Arthrobacter sp. AET 35A]NOJ61417.1 DNA-binding protein [Arthrobacter sp. 260]NOJ64009.1 DNA-binding protein [Arthrobacter sp. 147(2020)]
MAKAAPAEQLRLLELQALDSRLNQLQRQAATARANPALAELAKQLEGTDSELVATATVLSDLERDLTRAEDDVQSVVNRLERDQKRLDSGTGSPKDLTALQSEIASLTKRRSDLEDVELDIMERVDAARAAKEAAQQRKVEAQERLTAIESTRDAELATIEEEAGSVRAQRSELAGTFDAGLLALYEKTLARRGVGAARLFHGTSEGSGMQLSPGDLAELKKAAEDDIVFCPDSGAILVRSAEWGN